MDGGLWMSQISPLIHHCCLINFLHHHHLLIPSPLPSTWISCLQLSMHYCHCRLLDTLQLHPTQLLPFWLRVADFISNNLSDPDNTHTTSFGMTVCSGSSAWSVGAVYLDSKWHTLKDILTVCHGLPSVNEKSYYQLQRGTMEVYQAICKSVQCNATFLEVNHSWELCVRAESKVPEPQNKSWAITQCHTHDGWMLIPFPPRMMSLISKHSTSSDITMLCNWREAAIIGCPGLGN